MKNCSSISVFTEHLLNRVVTVTLLITPPFCFIFYLEQHDMEFLCRCVNMSVYGTEYPVKLSHSSVFVFLCSRLRVSGVAVSRTARCTVWWPTVPFLSVLTRCTSRNSAAPYVKTVRPTSCFLSQKTTQDGCAVPSGIP